MGQFGKVKEGLETGSLKTGKLQSSGGLTNQADTAFEALLEQEKIDVLEPGGFAKRDRLAAQLRAQGTEERRLKRRTNIAYRDALREGDQDKALAILMGAKEAGIKFGGIRVAGVDEKRRVQRFGEAIKTMREAAAKAAAKKKERAEIEAEEDEELEEMQQSQQVTLAPQDPYKSVNIFPV